MTHKGFVFYRGESLLWRDSPIIGIATLRSENRKTGDCVQTWILPEQINPVVARQSGNEQGTCGDCQLANGNGCYVNLGQAPLGIWKAYHAGQYPDINQVDYESLLRGRILRAGSYGDPLAIPYAFWRPLFRSCGSWLGYSHAWRNTKDFNLTTWKYRLMASTESLVDTMRAQQAGWRTFRVVHSAVSPRLDNEMLCPAIDRGITCAKCRLCNGATSRGRNIVIPAHGITKNRIRGIES